MSAVLTVYISIGNSDDKLSQAKWARFYREVSKTLRGAARLVHGEWVSDSTSPRQNACWCIEVDPDLGLVTSRGDLTVAGDWLRLRLAELAAEFGQNPIAWAEAQTTFIGPAA